MSRRPPRTSYGYLAPPGARVRGWECNRGCAVSDEPAPRSWPYPCPNCGRPADAAFEEPWAHDARGHWIRHNLDDPDCRLREYFELEQHVWAYKEALRRDDGPAADAAWAAYRGASPRMLPMLELAAKLDDIDRAVREIMDQYPHVDTRDIEGDHGKGVIAANFVSACAAVLVRESSMDHPRADEVYAAMRDVASRADGVLVYYHHRDMQRAAEVRDLHHARVNLAQTRRSSMLDGLPRVGPASIDDAIEAAEIHGDLGPLDELLDRLDRDGLVHLVRARRHIVTGDLSAAVRELGLSLMDRSAGRLRPQTLATLGLVWARLDPAALDRGIELCRSGRRAGRRWWRRTTAADGALARLLLERALHPATPPAQRTADVREAVRLTRRIGRAPGPDQRLLRQEALGARDGLTGRGPVERRHRTWRSAVEAPRSTAGKARLAVAWAEWAVGSGNPDFAAEAYQRLVALAAQDAVTRTGAEAKERVIAAAQEYAEEAGYWLGRAGRYRDAVVALETGRAVGLTEALAAAAGSDPPVTEVRYDDITAETGDGAIVYVAAARAGGCAFVVAAKHAPQYIDLPRLDRATVAALAADLLPGTAGAREVEPIGPPRADAMVTALRSLFDGGLDRVATMAGGRIVTLVPVGLLTLLPIHAAGAPGDEWFVWHHVGRQFAVRYAPNARALRRCRDTARDLATRDDTLLAVDAPGGPGVAPGGYLHHVARETAEVTRRWTGRPAQPLHACTWAEFQAAADDHTVWHLACHGAARPESIMDTRLYFADRHVTLEDLRRTLRPARRRLAVLSACQTNVSGSATPNEVVGLPSALIELGFAGVIATAWSVDDLATTYLMTAFYQRWCGEGAEPAVALNRAQQWLRTATRADLRALLPDVEPVGAAERPYIDPRYWAAFAYTGA
ncbi:CHAT domain-containing protein [Dactylosporangium sp. CA-139066]|uniref:CHAT domain-containing protein n=1 Tax=Dactylosporangium sp. CA-139066 TaxID=3239930 RepID=UPI003D8DD2B3